MNTKGYWSSWCICWILERSQFIYQLYTQTWTRTYNWILQYTKQLDTTIIMLSKQSYPKCTVAEFEWNIGTMITLNRYQGNILIIADLICLSHFLLIYYRQFFCILLFILFQAISLLHLYLQTSVTNHLNVFEYV